MPPLAIATEVRTLGVHICVLYMAQALASGPDAGAMMHRFRFSSEVDASPALHAGLALL